MRISSMFCPVFFALLGSALAGPIDIDADLKHNVDPGRLQKDLATPDEVLKNTAAVEEELELLKAAYAKTVIESAAPLNGSIIEDEDANEINENTGEEMDVLEGDVLLTKEQLALIETSHNSNRARRQAFKDDRYSWGTINPVIPYSYSAGYPKATRAPTITAAMKFWEKNTCVRFREVTSGYRVEIRESNRCHSSVGNVSSNAEHKRAGTQGLNLGEGCMNIGTVCHELSHTFGFFHVQERFDRDKYVRIDFSNLKTGDQNQFDLMKEDTTLVHDVPYEFGSNMHYAQKDFAIDKSKPVMHAKPGYEIYQQSMMGRLPTFYDILAVNRHFNCAAKCKRSITCSNDGVQDVNSCNKCLCPMGWIGDKCDQRPVYKMTLPAKNKPQKKRIDMAEGPITTEYRVEYYMITAPPGKKVQMTPKPLGYSWSNSCGTMGIEVKFLKEQRHAGLQACDPNVQYPTLTSETNEMLVQAYTLGGRLAVELEYKVVDRFGSPATCKTSVKCGNGGVPDVDNCRKCVCPMGWIGTKCLKRPTHTPLIAKSQLNTTRIDMTAGENEYKVEYYLIKAPEGMKVQMTPKPLGTSWKGPMCDAMGIEVKYLRDQRPDGLRVCDWRVKHPAITSETNEMLVQAYTRGGRFILEFDYKVVDRFGNDVTCKTSVGCANGGVQNLDNCNKCICPVGWIGDKCDKRPDHKPLVATRNLETLAIAFPANITAYMVEYYLIKAPPGMKVQMTPTVLGGSFRSAMCEPMGIEVKYLRDQRPDGLRVCDWRVPPLPITSETNEMLVQAYTFPTRQYPFAAQLEYKAVY